MNLLSMSSCSSLDRAPARCLGGYGFDSRRGLFFLSHARVKLITFHSLSLTGHVHIKKVVLKGKSALTFELFHF